MNPKLKGELDKLKAESSHLLDGFLSLRERYAMLHPMLFDQSVVSNHGQGRMSRGFVILKNNLFMQCCQDIATLSCDSHDGSVSIVKVIKKLEAERVVRTLESEYVTNAYPKTDEEGCSYWAKKRDERRMEFQAQHALLQDKWKQFSQSAVLTSFKTIRRKAAAHLDITLRDGQYVPLDIGSLNIRWGDIEITLATIQELVVLIGYVLRDASFDWDGFDRQIERASQRFWGTTVHD